MDKLLTMPMNAPDEGAGAAAPQATEAAQPAQQNPAGEQPQAMTPEQEFDEYRKAHQPQFQAWADRTFKDRFRGMNEKMAQERQQHQEMMQQHQPIMDVLAMRYGMDAGDITGIAQRVGKDDSLLAEAASAEGATVENYRQRKQLEAENRRYRTMENQRAEEARMQQHFQGLQQQAAEMQKTFPDFDLMTELQNRNFLQMTGPDMGMSLRQAYFALHADEIQQATMQHAIDKTMEAASQAIQSGTMRPREAGMSQMTGQVNPNTSPRNWTQEQRENARRTLREKGILRFD